MQPGSRTIFIATIRFFEPLKNIYRSFFDLDTVRFPSKTVGSQIDTDRHRLTPRAAGIFFFLHTRVSMSPRMSLSTRLEAIDESRSTIRILLRAE